MPDQPVTHNEMQQMMIIAEKNAMHSESIANSLKSLSESVQTVVSIKRDIEFVKWFVGIVGLAIIVATVVLRGIDNRFLFKTEVKEVVKEITRDMPNLRK